MEGLLQEMEGKDDDSQHAEQEIKEKDEKLKNLISELEEKGKTLSNYNLRIQALDDELTDKKGELAYISKELKTKDGDLLMRQAELKHASKCLADTENVLSLERHKAEKQKTHMIQRNTKILELETCVERQASEIISLQTRLESAEREVKKTNDKLHSVSSTLRRPIPPNTDVDSFLVRSPTNVSALSPPRKTSPKLNVSSPKFQSKSSSNDSKKTEQSSSMEPKFEFNEMKACSIIQSLMGERKKQLNDLQTLHVQLQSKEKEISKLKKLLKSIEDVPSKSPKTNLTRNRIAELKLPTTLNPTADTEVPNKLLTKTVTVKTTPK